MLNFYVCADSEVICCETVINPLAMFPHMTATAAAANDDDDDDDIKFIFTIRFAQMILRLTSKFRRKRI